MSTEAMDRIDGALVARSTAAFFDALSAADKSASEDGYNALLALTAPAPDTYASCCCGAELSIVSSEITLTDDERQAAGEAMAWREGNSFGALLDAAVQAINAVRAAADERFINDFYDTHAHCEVFP